MAAFFCLEQSALASKAERAEPIGKLNLTSIVNRRAVTVATCPAAASGQAVHHRYLLTASADANAALVQHRWPGNVRELENCIQRALVMSDTCDIEVEHLGIELGAQSLEEEASLQVQLRNQEEQLLLRTLVENNGVRKATAAQLGISERTLRHKLKQLRERGLVI